MSLILPRGRYYLYVETTSDIDLVIEIVLDTLPEPDVVSDARYAVDEGELIAIVLPVDTLLLVRTSSTRSHYVAIYDLEGSFVSLVKGRSNVFHVALLAGTYAMHVLIPYSVYYEDQFAFVNVHVERWELPEGNLIVNEDLVLGGNQHRMYDLELIEPSIVIIATSGVNDYMYLAINDPFEEVAYNDEEFSLGYGDYLWVFYSTLWTYQQPNQYDIYILNEGSYTKSETISIVVVPIRNIYH